MFQKDQAAPKLTLNTTKALLESICIKKASGKTTELFRGEKQKNDNWKDELKKCYVYFFWALELFYFLKISRRKNSLLYQIQKEKKKVAYAQSIEKH